MNKQVILGSKARTNLVKGIDTLADAVVSTLGPNGRNVVIANEMGAPQSTKEGVTVAKSIELKDLAKGPDDAESGLSHLIDISVAYVSSSEDAPNVYVFKRQQ